VLRPRDVLFGEIAVTLGLLSRKDLAECIARQKGARRRVPIGRICEELGYLSPRQVRRVLAEQARLDARRG
jgi:hypothetical protein